MLIEIMPTLFMILFLILILIKNRIITVMKMKVCNLSFDEFKDYEQKIDLFISTLINPQGSNNKDSFFHSI